MAQIEPRITKPVFIGTSSALLGICVVATVIRFYIRFAVQREIGWDDGWLVFGLCCLVAGMATLFVMLDLMYEMVAIELAAVHGPAIPDITSIPLDSLPPAILSQIHATITKSVRYRRLSVATLTPLWGSVCSVKFSFLALFKKLLRQMPVMTKYWWFVVVYNVAISIYGAVVFVVACPYFEEDNIMKSLQCSSGTGLALTMNHSIAQMVLDIVGDLLILVIPIIIIWQIRIRIDQKIALVLTLCLTVVMVLITAARIVGLKNKGAVDFIWGTYFLVVAAEVGLMLVAITAFRALYVSRTKGRAQQETITTLNWYNKGRSAVLGITPSKHRSGGFEGLEMAKKSGKGAFLKGVIPHATMTGMRTFIDKNGNESVTWIIKGNEISHC